MISTVLEVALQIMTDPAALGLAVLGTFFGILLGALPGVSSTMALAVLLPVTFSMSQVNGMMFLMGIFSASVFGGSISAILINIPGTPGAIMTQIDGYPMARNGRAGEALTYALLASTLGGILGWILLIVIAPVIAGLALSFRSPEYAAVTFFGLTMLAYASPGSTFKAIIGGILGLLIATIGRDSIADIARFDFGVTALQGGIDIIPAAVGVFGLAEVLRNIETSTGSFEVIRTIRRLIPPWREMRPLWPMMVRGSLIGAVTGAIPAAGSAIAVVVAYAQEKRISKHPERFGSGIPDGIVAPESANNACVGGALIPMMTLGIPGDSMTAVLIGALLIHGLRPGPALFTENPDFVALVYIALLVAIVLTLVIGLVGVRFFARVLQAPKNVLMTTIAILCVVGSYAVRNSVFDVLVMIAFGVLGYVMQRARMPVVPIIFGLILGPILEENVRRSLIVSGDWTVFLTRPISLGLILVSIAALIYPAVRSKLDRKRSNGGGTPIMPLE